jgi:hypothetical protein
MKQLLFGAFAFAFAFAFAEEPNRQFHYSSDCGAGIVGTLELE